jgi:hypothetical protein
MKGRESDENLSGKKSKWRSSVFILGSGGKYDKYCKR